MFIAHKTVYPSFLTLITIHALHTCLRVCLQQSRMEERLDDAIYVLRNHAESNLHLPPGHPAAMTMGPPHSNGLVPPPNMGPSPAAGGAGPEYPGGTPSGGAPHLTSMHPAPLDSHMVSHC